MVLLFVATYFSARINAYTPTTMNTRKLLSGLATLSLFVSTTVMGQAASDNYTVLEDAFINEGGTSDWIDCSSGTEIILGDDVTAAINWPFDYSLYNNDYTTTDELSISSNGFIRLDGVATTNGNTAKTYKLDNNGTNLGQIICLGIYDASTADEDSHVYYKVTGEAPNRVLTVEYVNLEIDYNDNRYADLQVSFYETSNNIAFRFGQDNVNKNNADIGMHSGINGYLFRFGNVKKAPNGMYCLLGRPLKVIDDHATYDTAISAPMTFAEMQATGVENITQKNMARYREDVNALFSVSYLWQLQNLVDYANLDIIDNFAITSTATSGTMSYDQLKVTGVTGLLPHLMPAYREAIDAAPGIPSLYALQLIVDLVNVLSPNNDDFANAYPINKNKYSVILNNTGYTGEETEPDFCANDNKNTMWLFIEPDVDGDVTIQAGQDCIVSLYSGDDMDSLTPIVECHDENNFTHNGETNGEEFTASLTEGNRYYFRVEAYGVWNNGNPQVFGVGEYYINITGNVIQSTWNGSEWSTGEEPEGTDDVVVEEDLDIEGELEVEDLIITTGTTVTVEDGETLTVTGNIIVEPGGELVNTGTVLVTGAESQVTTVGLTANQYSYFSSPVQNAPLSGLNNPTTLYHYDEDDSQWIWYDVNNLAAEGNFVPARGYAITYAEDTPITFTGVFNDGDFTVPITNQGTYDGGGWNLVGNPYPSAINAQKFLDINPDINHNVSFWDNSDYATHNGTFGVNPTGGENPTGRIGVGQGFFVRSLNATGNVNFENQIRIGNGQFYRAAAASMIRVRLENDKTTNAFEIHLRDDVTYGFDNNGMDIVKLKGNPDMAFYSVLDDKELILQGIPTPKKGAILPIGYDVSTAGTYRIVVEKAQNLPSDATLWLVDKYNGTEQLVEAGEAYTFQMDAGSHKDRFEIRIAREAETGYDEQVMASVSNGEVILSNAANAQIEAIQVFDISGKLIHAQSNGATINTESLPAGVYVFKIKTTTGELSQKLVVD